jgi:hypothetical protein
MKLELSAELFLHIISLNFRQPKSVSVIFLETVCIEYSAIFLPRKTDTQTYWSAYNVNDMFGKIVIVQFYASLMISFIVALV